MQKNISVKTFNENSSLQTNIQTRQKKVNVKRGAGNKTIINTKQIS